MSLRKMVRSWEDPEYRNSLYVAFHGSWNRSVPTGYKVVRIPLDAKGEPAGPPQDFVSGWLAAGERRKGRASGRPVGVLFGADGSLFISDDSAGKVTDMHFVRRPEEASRDDSERTLIDSQLGKLRGDRLEQRLKTGGVLLMRARIEPLHALEICR